MLLQTISGFLDQYNLPWLILAILSWVAIFLFCSYRDFLNAFPVGIWTMVVGATLEYFFTSHEFWTESFIMVPFGRLDFFVIVGPFFSIGVLLIKFLPDGKWSKILMVLLFSIIATGIELVAVKIGFLTYHEEKWGALYSLVAYYLGLMSALGFYYVYYNIRISPSKSR